MLSNSGRTLLFKEKYDALPDTLRWLSIHQIHCQTGETPSGLINTLLHPVPAYHTYKDERQTFTTLACALVLTETDLSRRIDMPSRPQVSKSSLAIANVNVLHANIMGLASAGFMMAFFGAAWWGWGVGDIHGVFPGEMVTFFIVLALATIILLGGGILLLRAASHLPQTTSSVEKTRGAAEGTRYGRIFGLVFGLEIVIIALGSILLNVFHHPEFLLPFVSIVVGVHFFPLASLFNVHLYYVTGILLVLAGVIVMLVVPVHAMIGNLPAWNALVGSICAVILWLTGIYAELLGRSFFKLAQGLLGTE